jgi:hypothetical protein
MVPAEKISTNETKLKDLERELKNQKGSCEEVGAIRERNRRS